ncbi:O-antigen ligase family protein [Ramlibacter sp. AN1015]|uniref:O-antigen ligase family protein n=1 Tax=Ramlibacter sp. AN1015 TaxID=3133428 RepID=UPI0030BBDA91
MKHRVTRVPTREPGSGLLHWIFPAMLCVGALDVLLIGRDLTQQFASLMSVAETPRHPVMPWVQRAVSVFLLVAALQQIVRHLAARRPIPSATLLISFVAFWIGTVGLTALFAANPLISHEYVYSLVVGVAICLVGVQERERIQRTARDALFVLMLVGLLLIPLKTTMVLDTSYTQGLIPGLPRFGGVTAHPVTQGMLAQVALLVLWCVPYQRRWLNVAAWVIGLGVLFIAQSKTAWTAFAACAMVLLLVRNAGPFWRRVSDPRTGSAGGVLVCLLAGLFVLGFTLWVLLGDPMGRAQDFASTREGAQLMSLTGRDRIWEVAMSEWRLNPTFGYGLSLWDSSYRAAINMPNATHAHNQFLDDLARSGSVGATTLVIYAAVLLAIALRSARASGGLSLALFVAIALRSVSEVPLSLMGYGTELFTHLLLLATLAAASAQRRAVPRRAPMPFGVASS